MSKSLTASTKIEETAAEAAFHGREFGEERD